MLKTTTTIINASQITGTLPVANGGTGVTTSTGTGNTVLSAAPTLSGDVTLSTGNIIQGTAAKGINFTANTQAAGMTSELLNWYEEGTWTPTVAGSTTPGTQTYIWRRGTYTRIGNRVMIDFQVYTSAKDAATAGSMTITGLPFTANNNTGIPQSFIAVPYFGITPFPGDLTVGISVANGTTTVKIATFPSTNDLNVSGFGASVQIFGNFHYFV